MTNTNTTITSEALSEYSDQKRLAIFNMLTGACSHLYSKGKLQTAKFMQLAPIFADLAKNDPIFMAHLTAWAAKKDAKDMRVLTVFFNALNDADGTPFFPGSTKNKPNMRNISATLLQDMEPHLAARILEFCHMRFSIPELLNEARHFPTSFQRAYKKYLRYREQNPEMLYGIRRKGLSKKMTKIYRLTHTSPSESAASILNWQQGSKAKGNLENIAMKKLPDFKRMKPAEVAEAVVENKLSPMVALSTISPDKITASVAKSLLSNCTGNQSIILYRWFAKNGFLDVASIKSLFNEKIKTATTAVDRIDTLTRDADEEDKTVMAQARSKRRKKDADLGSLGKIFLHIDTSGSMRAAIEFAKERASIIAECVDNPKKNFRWGHFGTQGRLLPMPESFTKEDFYVALYGLIDAGYTDCVALYGESRRFGADVDIYITDQGHNVGTVNVRIEKFHADNPGIPKPRAAVIVDFSLQRSLNTEHGRNKLRDGLVRAGIPVAIMKPDALTESALVAQAVNAAVKGEVAVIEEIMKVALPRLPKWWGSIPTTKKERAAVAVATA